RAGDPDPDPVAGHGGSHRRPFWSPPHGVLAAVDDPHRAAVLAGQLASRVRSLAVDLAAEGAAVGQRGVRVLAGPAPGRVRLEVGGLDPGRAQGAVPIAGREVDRMRDAAAAAPPLHLAGLAPGLLERLADGPAALAVGD